VFTSLGSTVLAVPIANLVAFAIACPTAAASDSQQWMGTSMGCGSSGAIMIRVVLGILFVAYHMLLFIAGAVVVDRNPASKSWGAKSHG